MKGTAEEEEHSPQVEVSTCVLSEQGAHAKKQCKWKASARLRRLTQHGTGLRVMDREISKKANNQIIHKEVTREKTIVLQKEVKRTELMRTDRAEAARSLHTEVTATLET